MVRFRIVFSLVVVVLLAGGWLWGQDPKTTGKGKGTLPLYWSKIGLSDEQRQKALSVRSDFGTKIDGLKLKISQLETEERAELAKILTAAQKKQLQKILASKVPGGDATEKDEKKEEKPSPDKKP